MPVLRDLSKYKNVLLGKDNQRLLLGIVKDRNKVDKSIKVECSKMSLDENLNEYFMYSANIWAHDPNQVGHRGDTVLMRLLEKPRSPTVSHSLERVVHKLGAVADPITGHKVAGTKFLSEITNENYLKDMAARQKELEKKKFVL